MYLRRFVISGLNNSLRIPFSEEWHIEMHRTVTYGIASLKTGLQAFDHWAFAAGLCFARRAHADGVEPIRHMHNW